MIVALWTFLGGLALWAAYEWGHRTGVREMQHFADAMVTALEDLTLTDGTTIGERAEQCVKAGCKFTDEGIEHVGPAYATPQIVATVARLTGGNDG